MIPTLSFQKFLSKFPKNLPHKIVDNNNNKELKELNQSEMWQAGKTVRSLRPENN
jgi:hypothetical protein